MALQKGSKSNDGDDANPDPHRLEVIHNDLLEEQSSKLDNTYPQQRVTIAENAKSISKLNDMILGISVQLTKLISDKEKSVDITLIIGTTSSSQKESISEKNTHQ
ncbi:hypothetical protein AgCh_001854 [Apium graveolens]